jgi:diguanylate cyclase (GGDEF)-like protein/PAS domain S-box-containing protein
MEEDITESLGQRALARLAAAMWVGSGALVLLATILIPAAIADHLAAAVVGGVAVVVGIGVWFLPWDRWHPRTTIVLLPVACLVIALFNGAAGNPWIYSPFFIVSFVWVGLAQPQGTATACVPFLALAYWLPAQDLAPGPALRSMLFVVPVCVLLGESAALVAGRLRAAERRHAAAEQRFSALIEQATEFILVLDEDGHIRYASPGVTRSLGWSMEELLGRVAGELIHADDVGAAVGWFQGTDTAPVSEAFEYRAAHRDGSWRWVEGVLTDLRDDPAVRGVVWNGRDITERRHAAEELFTLATRDGLTGLLNRNGLLSALDDVLATTGQLAVVAIDLDDFKVVNDTLGHLTGDELLRAIARTIEDVAGDPHLIGRLGGDEFIVVVRDAPPVEVAEALRVAVGAPFHLGPRRFVVSASFGVATGSDRDEVLRHADLALYEAKGRGRNRVVPFDEGLARRARRRLDVETELRAALDRDELFVEYQPEVRLPAGTVIGAEALVRWRHPTLGVVAPGEFIDIAEDAGLVGPLGSYVLDEACRMAARWSALDPRFTVACNVSPVQLRDDGFVAQVADTLRRRRTPPSALRLELTESALLSASGSDALAELRHLGVQLAIDDFGTGYSSLNYLHRLSVDTLKVDRSFLADVVTGDEALPLVEAILTIAHALGLHTVAEGVETLAHRALVERLGCDAAQGFLFGRSLAPAHLEKLIGSGLRHLRSLPDQAGTA